MYLQFPDDHNLDADLSNIDVSEGNLVLNLYKQESCKGLWDSFEAGSGEENLKVSILTDFIGFIFVLGLITNCRTLHELIGH